MWHDVRRAGRRARLRARPATEPATRDTAAQPRVAMLFSATGWTFNVRLGRSGREEGEGIIIMGEVSYRTAGRRAPRPSGPRHGGEVRRAQAPGCWCSSPQETVLTIPLEPFAMQRLQDRLKDLVSGYGMALRVGFTAEESARAAGARRGRLRLLRRPPKDARSAPRARPDAGDAAAA